MPSPSKRRSSPVILALVVCFSAAEFAPAAAAPQRVSGTPDELVPEQAELPQIVPLPPVEPSDSFSTSPVTRTPDLSAISLSAAPPPGSPAAPSPLRASPADDDGARAGRSVPKFVSWTAPALSHTPVYFEEVGVERYGQTCAPVLQPVLSGGKFLVNAAIWPYKMGVDSPRRVAYDVGLARPGSPVPGVREALPFSWKGVLYQGAAATGAVLFVHP